MSVKHIKEYYNKICEDYHEMINTLHELEEEASKNLVPPEQVENLNNLIKPMKDNYERWSYMIFLLNMPNKKEKKKVYNRQFKDVVDRFEKDNDLKALQNEDKKSIDTVKNAFK